MEAMNGNFVGLISSASRCAHLFVWENITSPFLPQNLQQIEELRQQFLA
jgi:hypothetical protein